MSESFESNKTVNKTPAKVDLGTQTLWALLLGAIGVLIASHRIKKFKNGCLLALTIVAVSVLLDYLLGYPSGLIVSIIVNIPLSVLPIRQWTREYNEKISLSGR